MWLKMFSQLNGNGLLGDSAAPTQPQHLSEYPTIGPNPAAATFPSTSSQLPSQLSQANIPPSPGGSHVSHMATTPVPNHSNRMEPHVSAVENDTGPEPRFSAAEKGKQPANPYTPMLSEDESIHDESEGFAANPPPAQVRSSLGRRKLQF